MTEEGRILRHAKQQTGNGLFLKTALVLWILALVGALLVLPYVTTLENKALAAAAEHAHLQVRDLLAISVAQTAVLMAIVVVAGQWAAWKVGLGTPLIVALLARTPAPDKTPSTLLIAFALGVVTALALMLLEHWIFAPIPSVGELVRSVGNGSPRPSAWQGLLASFYGAFDEEILMRFGLMSLLVLALRTLVRIRRRNRELAPSIGSFWAANIMAAIVFGLGHLPATAALAPLSAALVVRAVILNGTAGLVFGELYRRYGLEWAMTSHFGVDIVLHVALA